MIFSEDDFFFLPLGGSGEIGMNCYLYHFNNSWVMIDLGVTFGDSLISPNELIMPKLDFIFENNIKLDALILTHAHEDHIGAVPYLFDKIKDIPIYTTSFTASVLKRKFQSNNINEFKINLLDYNKKKKIGGFEIEILALTHSIPEPNGVILKTGEYKVFHTGDWKIDPNPLVGKPIDEEKLRLLGDQGVDLMVCDSTNVFNENPSGSEKEVREAFKQIFSEKKVGTIVVTCFASNVARLETILKVSEEFNKVCLFLGRSIHKIYESATENDYLINQKNIINEKDLKSISNEDLVLICTGSQGEPNAALSNLVNDNNKNIKLSKNDLVIFSSREIPGNEKKINKLKEKILKIGCEIYDQNTRMVHVSGHPSKKELKKMYKWINPNTIIPVHGEYRHLNEHKKFARSCGIKNQILVQNGDLVLIKKDDQSKIIKKVNFGRNILKGKQILPLNHQIFENLKILNSDGEIFINIIMNLDDEIIHEPVIFTSTISIDIEDLEDLKEFIITEINSISQNCIDDNILKNDLKKKVKSFFKKRIGLKPFTNFEIVRL